MVDKIVIHFVMAVCIDNKDSEEYLTVGKIYGVLEEKDGRREVLMTDNNRKLMPFNSKRFVIIVK